MISEKIHKLVLTALFAALACAATFLHIPSPLGYLNLGDCIVIVGALLLGPVYGAAAGGIGPMLADLILGYADYAPVTFAVKALMGLTAASIFSRFRSRKWVGLVLAGLCAEIIMAGGYFLYELLRYGLAGSLTSLLSTNLPQAAVGFAATLILYPILDKSGLAKKLSGGFAKHD